MNDQESSESNSVTEPIPVQGKCHFYINRKKRLCRFSQMKNTTYCAEHATLMGVNLERKRISCPLDPKHSCYEDQLQKHLKKCQRAQGELPPYHHAGVNSGDSGGENVPEPKVTVLSVSTEEIQEMVDKVNRLFEEHIGDIPSEILSHESLQEELNNPSLGLPALRHRKQQASLIGHMEKAHLLRDDMCYMEMGAGKGQLSHWLYSAVSGHQNISFVLVDRSAVRYKYDNLHKEDTTSDGGSVMERIKIDIENLNLGNLLSLKQIKKAVVAFGKHLCGSATDLALRCVMETLISSSDGDESHEKLAKPASPRNPAGVVIALCCHHRCTWQAYVGKAFFKSCGLSVRDFQLISSMTSWATCCWKGWRSDSSQGQRSTTQSQKSTGSEEKATQESDICFKKCLDNQESQEMINCENNEFNQKMTKIDSRNQALLENSDKSDTQAQTTKGIGAQYDTEFDDVDDKEHDGDQEEMQEMKRCMFSKSTIAVLRRVDFQQRVDFSKRIFVTPQLAQCKSGFDSSLLPCHAPFAAGPTGPLVPPFQSTQPSSFNLGQNKMIPASLAQETRAHIRNSSVGGPTRSYSLRGLKFTWLMSPASPRYVFKLSEKEREEVGRKCKHLIDYGRVMYLKDKGLNSQLKVFIENYYTPENVILLATSGSGA